MTPLGLNTTAVPEAAALFPLGAAASAAAAQPTEGAASASSAFGDLLAASFGQQETPANAAAGDKSAAKRLSIADSWFATLSIDFNALNAGLDAEETSAPSAAASGTTASPVNPDDLACADGADDEDADAATATLMALMVPVPVPVPMPPVEPLPAAPSATSESQVAALTDLQSLYSSSIADKAPAQAPALNVAQAVSSDSSQPAPLTPAFNVESVRDIQPPAINVAGEQKDSASSPKAAVPASATTSPVMANPASAQAAASSEPTAVNEATTLAVQAQETPNAHPNAAHLANVTKAPEHKLDAAQPSQAMAVAGQSPVETKPKGQVIDLTPAVQQNERPRNAMAAKVADAFGPGQIGIAETPASVAPEMADTQSQSQNGGAQEAFALGLQENMAPARSGEGSAPSPIFTVGQSHAAVAAPAAAQPAEMPHAPAFTNTPAPENVGRLIESMKVQLKEGIQEATVHLKPEHLGEVTISVRVERGAVSAVVHTDAHGVQQWLEAQEEKLRQGLSEQGLHLERFYVHRDGSQQQPREQPRQQTQSAQRYRQQRNDSSVRFEVVV